ncbi:MAG: hypothetical protein HY466_01030, partial [Deltaproteobacteria bacterium]|nr:hypothetical protein [Deltaproteobacteria bacterium]
MQFIPVKIQKAGYFFLAFLILFFTGCGGKKSEPAGGGDGGVTATGGDGGSTTTPDSGQEIIPDIPVPVCDEGFVPNAEGVCVIFPDPVLEAGIRAAIALPEGEMTMEALQAITALNLS